MKKSIKYSIWSVILFGAGAYIGSHLTSGYYKSLNLTNLIVHQTQQVSSYAILFGEEEGGKAKELMVSDLKLNLIKAKIHQDKLPSPMTERVCKLLLQVVKERKSLEAFASDVPQTDTNISKLISDVSECKTW